MAKSFKLRLVEELLASISDSYELVNARVEEGRSAPLEGNMLLVELNRVRAMRETTERDARVAIIELDSLIGREDTAPLRIRGDLNGSLTNLRPVAELTAQAIRERPDLSLLRAFENLADAKADAARKDAKVDAAATLGYQRLRISDAVRFNYLVFGIKFTLPHRNQGRDAIEAAIIDRQAMERRREFGELVVRKEVEKAVVTYESAVRSREIRKTGVVAQASQNLDVVRQMYDLGAVSLLEYLAEQRRVIELRQQLIDADLEVYQARVEVDRATNAPDLVTR